MKHTTTTNETMKTHKTQTDDMNIEAKLFEVDGEFRVRVRDLDAGENITVIYCKDRKQAEEKYAEAIAVA